VSRASDHELVRRLRAGDTGAWDVLDRRYRPQLERFARRMLYDVASDQVQDVVQEALWRAHRACDATPACSSCARGCTG
jgi:DNA-directed RNA polymerase specialized sigma24 family protein